MLLAAAVQTVALTPLTPAREPKDKAEVICGHAQRPMNEWAEVMFETA